MLKAERKEHRDRRHRRLFWGIAALLMLAASVAAAILLSRGQEEFPVREDHSGMLIDRMAEELVSITVRRKGEEAWTLVRTESGEWLPESGEFTAEEQQGTFLEEAMTQLRYEEILTEDPEIWRKQADDFGLSDPKVSVTGRYTDGTETTVNVGNNTGLEEGWFYLTAEGDDRLYAVSAGVVQDLDVEYALLRPVPRPEIYAALLDRITVLDREGETLAEWVLRGKITDRDAGTNWAVEAPFRYPADEESIQNLKKSAENLRLGVYTAPVTEETLAQYGMAQPELTLIFHMAAGSTGTVSEAGAYDVKDHEESTVILYIGKARDDLADYVRFGDEIFTVSHFTLSAFTEQKPIDTIARYPVLTPLLSLERLTVEENGEIKDYLLSEKEQNEEEEGSDTRECRMNGEEISYSAFEAAYDRLLTVTFSGVLPAGAEWKEPYKKYTFRTLSGGTHTVELCDWDGIHDAVTVDGSTMFYLIKGGMTGLPAESR